MPAFNKTIVVGNLTRDVEVKYPGETAVCDVDIAINEKVKKDGKWVDGPPTFVTCTTFGRNAEVVGEYCGKGDPILIEGRLKLDKWEDKEGHNRQKLKVITERIQLIKQKGGGSGGGYSESTEDDEF